jgi:hypothetical protein
MDRCVRCGTFVLVALVRKPGVELGLQIGLRVGLCVALVGTWLALIGGAWADLPTLGRAAQRETEEQGGQGHEKGTGHAHSDQRKRVSTGL